MRAALVDTREQYQDLFSVYWPIGVGIFAVIAILLIFAALRFRSDRDEFPQGKSESHAEEVYAAAIAVIAAVLLFLTYNTMDDLAALPFDQDGEARAASTPAGTELVKVIGAQWEWRFEYPRHGVVEEGEVPSLVVPQNTPVRFEMTSDDVIHSFYVPERRIKLDLFPGRTTTMTLAFPQLGFQRQGGECAQYCGWRHSYMEFNVHVVTPERYRQWIESRRTVGPGA